MGAKPVVLCVGQYSDLSFDEICKLASEIGYDGLEVSFRSSFIDMPRAAADKAYADSVIERLDSYGLKAWAAQAHMYGQCVGDYNDPRLDNLCPEAFRGKPDEIRKWAIEQMMLTPVAAKNLGIPVVTGFMGSTLWKYNYFYPQTSPEFVEKCWQEFLDCWVPILDEYERNGVKFGLEVHPTEMAYDYYTTQELLERLNYHKGFGINYDPSHLVWQGVDPVVYLRDFAPYVVNTHMKDVYVKYDGKNGILGSYQRFGDLRRVWNFRSLGHGIVNFDDIIRQINKMDDYHGPLAVEWEDNGMTKQYGAKEAFDFIQKLNYSPSAIAFDAVTINKDKK